MAIVPLPLMTAAPPRRSPRIALAGWFGSDNLGDELIREAMVSAVRARRAEPVIVTVRRDHAMSPGAPGPGGAPEGAGAVLHRSPLQHRSLTRALLQVGAMAVTGGVMQAETSLWNVPFHASRLRAAAAAGCAVAAIGLGVGKVPDRFSRSLVRRSLGAADILVVRDSESAERLRRWGVRGIETGADPVLGIDPAQTAAEDAVCVILRHGNRRGLLTAAARSRLRPPAEEVSGLARAIDAVASALGLVPRLVAFQPSRDEPLHRAVADRLDTPAEAVVPTLGTVLSEVARSRLVITMRYHGAVAALLHGRPAVLLDYSPKMASLAAEGGGWAPAVDPGRITAGRLAAAAAAAFDAAERIPEARAALKARLGRNDAALDALVEAASAIP